MITYSSDTINHIPFNEEYKNYNNNQEYEEKEYIEYNIPTRQYSIALYFCDRLKHKINKKPIIKTSYISPETLDVSPKVNNIVNYFIKQIKSKKIILDLKENKVFISHAIWAPTTPFISHANN
jgi:hypothetical protein